jgi:2-methylcitrate dehydratase PrpD
MHTLITDLAEFASGLNAHDIPLSVVKRVRLQHLHVAGLVHKAPESGPWTAMRKMGAKRGSAIIVGGGTAPPKSAARIHAARIAWTDQADHLLGGVTGIGGVTAAWAESKGSSVGDVLVATVAANEVAGRIGASLLLGANHGLCAGWVHAVAAAVAAGKMAKLGPDKMSHAIALALVGSGPVPRSVVAGSGRASAVSTAVAVGMDAYQQAAAGVQGSVSLLEAPGGMLESSCWLPLKHAFTGLGDAWLTETIGFPRWPGPAVWHSTYDAVNEVLQRHIKAADKRLRADQVKQITVRVPAPSVALDQWMERHGLREAASLGHAVRHGIGALVVDHALGVEQMAEEGWEERRLSYGKIASKVRVEHDISLTLDLMGHMVDTVAPLIGGVTEGEWKAMAEKVRRPEVAWPSISFTDVRSLVQYRPDRWFKTIRYASRNLADSRLSEWQMRLGSNVEIATTRGGTWPERRIIPADGPGWSWNSTKNAVLERHPSASEGDLHQANDLLDVPVDEDASTWLVKLLD